MEKKAQSQVRRASKRLVIFWPQVPLAAGIIFVGLVHAIYGLSTSAALFKGISAFKELTGSLLILGGTAQSILGLMLVATGIGLILRLVSAWTLTVLLLIIMAGLDLVQERFGVNLFVHAALLAALWVTRHHFIRRTILANFVFSLSSIAAILAYGTIGSYLLGRGFKPPIDNWNTSIYYTIVTLSTVGYGDIVPVSIEARWFAVSLLVLGLGVFAGAIASILGPKISVELHRIFNPKRRAMQYDKHIILIGDGAIARNTAKELEARHIPFVQIVATDADRKESTETLIIKGDATDDDLLREAGIQRARLVIAAREEDGENAFIALMAKDMNSDVHVLAVASSTSALHRLKLAGADLVFSPAAVGGRLIADLAENNQIPPFVQDLLKGELSRS